MRVLILGVTGMLGNAIFKAFFQDSKHEFWGTIRNEHSKHLFAKSNHPHLISGVDVLNLNSLITVIKRIRPEIVINCTGLIKQIETSNNPLFILPINSIFPHQLSELCFLLDARLIQLSSDCVYSGIKGDYKESDPSDAEDLYGRSKFLGELNNVQHAITLRTSGIGHELQSHYGLLEWFLTQKDQVKGYTKAIYSGLPSIELARIIKDFILPHSELNGLYHISSKPISKFNLLKLISEIYSKHIEIIPDATLVIDRSLSSKRFSQATGYIASDWPELIRQMYNER